jgi:hypothetical protein
MNLMRLPWRDVNPVITISYQNHAKHGRLCFGVATFVMGVRSGALIWEQRLRRSEILAMLKLRSPVFECLR